jgi:PhnB protein
MSPQDAAHGIAGLVPYVFLNGRCDEAIEFYRSALGAEVTMLLRFKDNPAPQGDCPPVSGDRVMHASLRIGNAELLLSDGCEETSAFQGFGLSLTVRAPADAERCFAGLADGGEVQMPLGKTFFSPSFGMVKDRFGVLWMVYVSAPTDTPASGRNAN